MTRVLHLGTGNMYGGVETLLVTLARERRHAPGVEAHFAVCFDGRLRDELTAEGVPVHRLPAVRLRDPFGIRGARRALMRLVAAEAIQAVVVHSPWALAVFGPSLRRGRVPIVFWLNDRADSGHWLHRIARRTTPDLVICNSRYTAGTLPALFPEVPHRVLYYPVSPPRPVEDARGDVRREIGTPEDAVVVLQVSRMEPWKGHRLHLQALARLDTTGAQWEAWFVGGAQRPEERRYRDELESLARELGIAGRVRFLGQRSDVPRLYAAADLHCQPNEGPEPFGLVFVEALYAGLPCVTTGIGGAPEILDRSCGVVVRPSDPEALASELDRLIGEGEMRREMGAAGPGRAAGLCAPERQVRAAGEAIASVVNRGG